MKNLKLKDRVEIHSTSSDLDGTQGVITGCSVKDAYVTIWIVTLDKALKDGSTTVAMPDVCLKKAKTYKGLPVYDIESDWFDEWQRTIYRPIDKKDYDYFTPFYPTQPVAKCSRCGRDIYAVESYSCPNSHCPTQPRSTL